ncbi:MAG TPA: hypothetical protein VG838_08600 [Opitutaceae bacterium]|nr:hypothetical protein [Opitutaceae bacterium]
MNSDRPLAQPFKRGGAELGISPGGDVFSTTGICRSPKLAALPIDRIDAILRVLRNVQPHECVRITIERASGEIHGAVVIMEARAP